MISDKLRTVLSYKRINCWSPASHQPSWIRINWKLLNRPQGPSWSRIPRLQLKFQPLQSIWTRPWKSRNPLLTVVVRTSVICNATEVWFVETPLGVPQSVLLAADLSGSCSLIANVTDNPQYLPSAPVPVLFSRSTVPVKPHWQCFNIRWTSQFLPSSLRFGPNQCHSQDRMWQWSRSRECHPD